MFRNLTELYNDRTHFMVTAHRGASYEFPENTLCSMEKAVEAGADMIEFDLRGTSDGVPVLLHDHTIDRTSNGTGEPETMTLSELKKLNFSYWLQDVRRTAPLYDKMEIPTFEEILVALRDKVCMNIQVYAKSEGVLKEICRLYKKYDMYDRGYFTVYPELIPAVRAIDRDIELCTTRGWQDRTDPENLRRCKEEDGCRFVQPIKNFSTAESFRLIRELGLRGNVFFCDDPDELSGLKALGAEGILTNKAHLMVQAVSRLNELTE